MDSLKELLKRYLASKRNRYIALGCCLGICFLILWTTIFSSFPEEESYYIGQDNRWRHLNLMGKERNFATFTHDLLAAIGREEDFDIHMIIAPSTELLPQLEEGLLQGILSSLQPTPLNSDQFIFSNPYFLTGPVLIIPSTAPLRGWNEKRKKIIGIQAQSHFLFSLEQDPSIQIKIYEDMLKALSDLSERRIDGAALPFIPAYTYVTTFYKDKLKIATVPLTEEGVRLVALKNKEGEQLIQQFNQGLATLKQNGTYKKILAQWGLIDAEHILSSP